MGAGVETYFTIEEVAKYLNCAEKTIRKWVLNREIPFHKIHKNIRFRLSEIEKWVDSGDKRKAAGETEIVEGELFQQLENETETSGGTADGRGAQKCARTGEGVDEMNVPRRAPTRCNTDRNVEGGGV
jgi:excisionase family DNA binding protein